jgi:hypothetical protein
VQDLLEDGEAGLGQVVRLLPRLPVLFPAPLFPARRHELVAEQPALSPVSEFTSIFNSPVGHQPGWSTLLDAPFVVISSTIKRYNVKKLRGNGLQIVTNS